MSDGGRARWRRRFRPTTEREVRFAKLTVKLLLAAEVKQNAIVQWCEFQGYDYPLQVVSQIIARMVAGLENDAREPHEILADGAEHFVDDENWWADHFLRTAFECDCGNPECLAVTAPEPRKLRRCLH